MQHVVIKALFHQKNYLAPLKPKKPKRMLDIGCGTGKWCFEMGMSLAYVLAASALTTGSGRISKVSSASSGLTSLLLI
jgi:precorrin-6B methylase 2